PIWCTYIGGNSNDAAACIILVDSYIVAGINTTDANLSYGNAFKTNVQASDGLIVQIHKNGQMDMISYIGGDNSDVLIDMIYINQYIHILSRTLSTSNLVDSTAIYNTHNGGFDFVWQKYTLNWQRTYGTYLGGNNHESYGGIYVDEKYIYIGGSSLSNNNITTNGSHQQLNAGTNDAFLIK